MTTRTPSFFWAHPERSEWLQKAARAGFAAKGVIYALIGAFAVAAAVGSGGQLGGGTETVRRIEQQPFGQVLLVLVGVGLLAYALWRLVEAIADTEGHGTTAKGWLKRAGSVGSAAMNGALGVVALDLVAGSSRASGEPATFVGKVMAQPFGAWLIGAIGIGLVVAAIHEIKQGYTRAFEKKLSVNQMSAVERRWATRTGMAGLISRGAVFVIIGIYLLKAAIEHQPGAAKGIGGALHAIASQPFGMVLLFVVAVGLFAYGVFQFVLAKYARLPAR